MKEIKFRAMNIRHLIRLVWNKDGYYELWIGKGHSDFDPIFLGLLIAVIIFCLGVPLLGLLIWWVQ